MHLRYALLALLAEEEAHGYALAKRLAARLGPFWHPNVGQVYQVLQQLARRGFVGHRDVTGGPRLRRVFRLTPRGQRALETWLGRRPGWPPPVRAEIFIRCLAAERDGMQAMAQQLARQETEYRRYLALVDEQAHRVAEAPSVTRRIAHEAVREQVEAQLRWLGRCRALLGGTAD